jgi:hypothetical protein
VDGLKKKKDKRKKKKKKSNCSTRENWMILSLIAVSGATKLRERVLVLGS